MKIPRASSPRPRGFTLIELLVSVGIFMVVMLITIGALVGMADADRKAQSIQAVVDNLNFALDDMSRNIRTGMTYHCVENGIDPGGEPIGNLSLTSNCGFNGSSYMAFEGAGGSSSNPNDQIVYWFAPAATCGPGYTGGCIEKSVNSGQTFLPLTSPQVFIDSLRFYVTGTCPLTSGSGCAPDSLQPKAVIVLSAHIQLTAQTKTTIELQTTVTQRIFDQ